MSLTKLHTELNLFFNKVREDGMTAVALCENEAATIKLLGFLQYATRQEIALKQILVEMEKEEDLTIVTDGSGIPLDVLEESTGGLKEVTLKKYD
jgi:hypothetical protein